MLYQLILLIYTRIFKQADHLTQIWTLENYKKQLLPALSLKLGAVLSPSQPGVTNSHLLCLFVIYILLAS